MNEAWLEFVGRWHPVLVHAPLGALLALLAVELGERLGAGSEPADQRRDRTPRRLLCAVTALSAIVTATTGWLLAGEGAYSGGGLDWHRRLGIAFAVVISAACLAVLLHRRRLYHATLTVALVLAVAAGHLGGELTHGAGFLTEPLRLARAPLEASPAAGSAPTWYETSIAPVFGSRCVRCHGEAKHKGGLALHDAEALLAGGDHGAVIVPGDASGSEMVRRLRLELEHDEHMPPSEKPQPTRAEVDAIAAWIAAGASFDAPPPNGSVAPADAAPAIDPDRRVDPPAPALVVPADRLEELRGERIHAEVVDPASQGLWVHFAARPDANDAFVGDCLRPVLPFVVDLSLAGTETGDEALAPVSRMPRLERLDLSRTACTSAGLEALAGHPTLRTLVLTATPIDDEALETLSGLPALENLFAWKTAVSPAGLAELQRRHAGLRIVADRQLDTQALETEAPVSLSRADRYEARNTDCPVTGKPIDPRFRIVHEGQVLGFCCSACPAAFWALQEAPEAGD